MATACFLFPHPDDEFAVTALIRDRRQAGIQVSCIYLTDGAFGGQSSTRRRNEALRALAGLGIPAGDVHFLGEEQSIADGSLHLNLDKALQALRELPAVAERPDEIFCPAWEGGHQDHDAVHLVALALNETLPLSRLRQYSIYHGAGLPGPLFHVMQPIAGNGPTEDRPGSLRERWQQVRFCMNYPSQWKSFLGLLPCVAWRMLSDGRLRLQAVDASRVWQPPHAGAPLYERRGFLRQAEFRRYADPFIVRRIACAGAAPT
ncbi:MAG: PIG-L family deacetylase [Arenimonas sp.]